MKKRILSISLASLLALSLVAIGCPAPVVDPVDPVVAPVEPIVLMAQTEDPRGVPWVETVFRAFETIEKVSGGRLVIKGHPGGAIVPADTEHRAVHEGILDIGVQMSMHWAGLHPVAPLFCVMIGGPTAMGHFYWFQVGPGLDLMNEMWEKVGLNVKGVAVIAQEEEVFLYMNKPMRTAADLHGLKLRLFADEAAVFVKEFGVVPLGIPSPELYEAVAKGVIDGFQHGHLMVDWRMGFHEIVDYVFISPVRQPSSTLTIIVNRDVWADLPDDLRLLAETIFWKYGAKHNAIMTAGTIEYMEKWVDFGVPLLPVPAEIEEAVLRGAAALYAERAAADPFYARVWESLADWAAGYKATFPRL